VPAQAGGHPLWVAYALGLVPKKVAEETLGQETLEELARGQSIVSKERTAESLP
jgi:hypothetical protein